jgi:trk system potassium uptake protein TrkA
MKIIVAGAGDIGLHLCKMLQKEKHTVSLIDTLEEPLKKATSFFDGHTYNGSATSFRVLQQAKVEESDLFIAVTNNEFANITACLLARRFGSKKCLCRIDNFEYLQEDKKEHFHDLGIDFMFYPEQIAADEIVNLIQQSVQSDSMTFGGGKLILQSVRIQDDSQAVNQSIDELYNLSRTPEFKVCGIIRENNTIIPTSSDIIHSNDLLYILSTKRGVELLTKYLKKSTDNIKSVIILGGSRVGINAARKLAPTHTVKLIEKNRTKSYDISNTLPGVLVINGDGRDIDLLMQEGISTTDAFVSVTGDAEVNMIACLLAKKMNVKKTIAEIENIDFIRLAENIEIDSIINKKILAASKIFSFTMKDDVSSVNCLTCSNAEILEYIAKPESRITQKPIKEVFPKNEAIIAGVVRNNEPIIPENDFQIRAFDKVIVFAMPSIINEVGNLFKSKERFF